MKRFAPLLVLAVVLAIGWLSFAGSSRLASLDRTAHATAAAKMSVSALASANTIPLSVPITAAIIVPAIVVLTQPRLRRPLGEGLTKFFWMRFGRAGVGLGKFVNLFGRLNLSTQASQWFRGSRLARFAPVLRTLALVGLFGALLGALGHAYGLLVPIIFVAAASALIAPPASRNLGVSVYTQIADLWVPAIWQQGQAEMQVNQPNLFRSPLVTSDPIVTAAVNGPGSSVNIPFIIEPRPVAQPQRERVAPDITKLGSGLQVAAMVNRVSPIGATALSRVIAGPDPVRAILAFLDGIRTYQFQTALLNQLTGIFGLSGTPNQAVGAFRALRLDNFSETGVSPAAQNLIDSDMMLDAVAKMGMSLEKLVGGFVFAHTDIVNSLNKQDQIDYIKNSQGTILYPAWKGLTVVVDDSLVRAGGVSGNVYFTLICKPGAVAFEQRPQVFTDKAGEVSAVQMDLTQISTNDVVIYDRTRYLLHPQGAKWNPQGGVPTYADAGPIDSEFADPANWALALNNIKNSGVVAVRTNG